MTVGLKSYDLLFWGITLISFGLATATRQFSISLIMLGLAGTLGRIYLRQAHDEFLASQKNDDEDELHERDD